MTEVQPKITEPGIYDLLAEDYHGDPCETFAIGSSGARSILNDCPALFWWNSPLNPEYAPVKKKVFSLGGAAHDLVLQGGTEFLRRNYVLGPDVNLLTKDGKAEKKEQEEAGMTVLKHKEYEQVKAMRTALIAHPFANAAFQNGQSEKSLFWKDAETGVWCKCRPDFLPDAIEHVPDYKTNKSAKPDKFMRDAYSYGYHQQGAWYLDGIAQVTGEHPRSFYFVVQEKEPPYLVSCIALDPDDVAWGRMMNRKALHLFAQCLETDTWPGYADDVLQLPLPGYAEAEMQRRHERGEFDVGEAA